MCLLLCAYNTHPRFPVILAANRDEFHARPALVADFWEDAPWVLGGRDLQGQGTWLAVTKEKRFAAITNFREEKKISLGAPSRGWLVSDFLKKNISPLAYAKEVLAKADAFAGFNLLLGDRESLLHVTNRPLPTLRLLPPGIHGISNGELDEPWPKLVRAKARFAAIVEESAKNLDFPDPFALLTLLADKDPAPDADLPQGTGIPLEWERALSAIFVHAPAYGTRTSTLAFLGEGEGFFLEVTYGEDALARQTHSFCWQR